MLKNRRIRRGSAVAAAVAVLVPGTFAFADHVSGVATYSACVNKRGDVYNLTQGTSTAEPCRGDDITVHLSGGDITAVTAGAGLTGGGAEGAVSLAVDPSIVQSRINGICPAGSSIRMVNQDGTVTCETSGGDITSVTVGHGLTGGGTTGNVNVAVNANVIQNRVTGQCSPGSSIRAVQQDGTVACQAEAGDVSGVTAGTGLTGGGTSGDVTLAVDPSQVQRRVSGTCAVGSAIRAIGSDGTVQCSTPVHLEQQGSSFGPLDLDAQPVICQTPDHVATASTVARVDAWGWILNGTGALTFEPHIVWTWNNGANWFRADTSQNVMTVQSGETAQVTDFGHITLLSGSTYRWGVRFLRADTGTVDPSNSRCEIMVDID